MHKNDIYYMTHIPIIRKNFDTTNSAKFKGDISIISNEHGIIMDWKIIFHEVWIDTFTTPEWFKFKPSIFNYRNKIFELLDLKQVPRPRKTSNNLIKLTSEQVDKLNTFFNDRNVYSSTIKMIVGILKGNNPGGEAKKPSSAEMVINSDQVNLKNFVILLDDLMFRYKGNFESLNVWAKEISLNDFTNLNSTVKKAFDFMQKSKSEIDFKIYLDNIKSYYKNYNNYARDGEKFAIEARKKYASAVEEKYKGKQLPFNFSTSMQYQKCHIYEYHILRNKVIDSLYEDNKELMKKYLGMISDPENFLPLPEEIHRQFDKDLFTYKLNGEIYPIDEKGMEYVKNIVDDKYKQIPFWFMTGKRKKYFEMRNQNIIFI